MDILIPAALLSDKIMEMQKIARIIVNHWEHLNDEQLTEHVELVLDKRFMRTNSLRTISRVAREAVAEKRGSSHPTCGEITTIALDISQAEAAALEAAGRAAGLSDVRSTIIAVVTDALDVGFRALRAEEDARIDREALGVQAA